MAANAGGRNANNPINNEHVEFSVKAEEDLYLQGSENTIRRVEAQTNYSCLMLKTQRFSSLFRHYAKYHGLRKDDLEYYFVNLLENEDTPESVQLQRGDTIMVRKRRKPVPPDAAADDDEFFSDMKELLDDEEHMDVVFVIRKNSGGVRIKQEEGEDMDIDATTGDNDIKIRAHKSVLTARTEYFKNEFRTQMSIKSEPDAETEESVIQVDPMFDERHVRYALEYIYTNRLADVHHISTDDLLSILHLSDSWMLRDLKRLVEHELVRAHLSVDTVARLYGATEDFSAKRLARSCVEYIMANLRQLAGNKDFEAEMKNYPTLCIPILKAAADLVPDGPAHKKQRTGERLGTPTSAGYRGRGSRSPVPDSDA